MESSKEKLHLVVKRDVSPTFQLGSAATLQQQQQQLKDRQEYEEATTLRYWIVVHPILVNINRWCTILHNHQELHCQELKCHIPSPKSWKRWYSGDGR
ncbi:unnamed protein product [Allacma fusca]|uniref:Uncharacterized protein n=1 Tax=Allacma fusca TaxID=39272 RepID=A0A8J2NXK5_9HEXA|nr:unnamed protein product [Allacma fusca]